MNTQQKFAKYLATTLAIFLIIAIIGGSIIGILFLTNVLPSNNNVSNSSTGVIIKNDSSGHHGSGHHGNLTAEDFSSRSYSFDNIENIELDASIYSIYFTKGTDSKILVDLINVHNDYTVEQDGNTLVLEEPDVQFALGIDHLFDLLDNANVELEDEASIRITLPENFKAHEIELDGGVGNISLVDLSTELLDIDAGVGNITGNCVSADSSDIDSGTGNIKLIDCFFKETSIDAGVGNITFSGSLYGNSDIDCGMGNVTLSLSDSRDKYCLSLEKGLGSIRIDGRSINTDDTYTENPGAPCILNINGGVGDLTISFANSF